ncbi:DNA polymerase III subunit gamma/tau [Microbacterium sp. AZCO]|uniref:DNA polymerase III subunit gamma/tau n=1 Tax=Microbacterium sp. AZCO TaxID=3142976 RepID=UPI0031F409F5
MTRGRDDDALSWDGDDDPTLDVGTADFEDEDAAREPHPVSAAVGDPPESEHSASVRDPDARSDVDPVPGPVEGAKPQPSDDEDLDRRQLSNASLIGIGILAGVYLLLTIGWLLGAARLQLVASLFLEPAAFQITLWLAVAALPLWFLTVFWLTRTTRSWVRFVLLVAGAVLLIPWPFVLAGAAL